ncbi:MAG: aminotransferase class III-fold pyridoxal phosphate-dependent enzyme, partial [Eudoraea sp.]|nr:aminotransferase class III-fold pyridoxal phosphate-dependent enzyme [Eudoraea sp.]
AIQQQAGALLHTSNLYHIAAQEQLAESLSAITGMERLFFGNSGAEANENALKLASFNTGKSRVIAFKNSFHGRTSAAVAVTDNPKINAPINQQHKVTFLDFEERDSLENELAKGDVCAVIIEAIQGVGGLDQPSAEFYKFLAESCKEHHVMLIADEVQSGFGRSGKFFAFQHYGIEPDIISMAKGMGNGFPVGGILIHEKIKASFGVLGTTFGGNHLACTAVLAVLEVMETEGLIANAAALEGYFREEAAGIPQVKRVKGRGLMLGLEFDFEVAPLREKLIYDQHVFTGGAKDKFVLRILPSLGVTREELQQFFVALKAALS